MRVEFLSPLYYIHKRIQDRAFWHDRRNADNKGLLINLALYAGHYQENGNAPTPKLSTLEHRPKSIKALIEKYSKN